MVDLLLLRRARENDAVIAPLQLLDEIARAVERPHLVDQLGVVALLRLADRVAGRLLDLDAGDRLDQHVATHPDVAVDPPQRRGDLVVAKRAVPGKRMVVVGVDERPVDVEDRRRSHV